MVSLGEISGEQFLEESLQTVEGITMKLVIPSALAVSVMVMSVFGKSESAYVIEKGVILPSGERRNPPIAS